MAKNVSSSGPGAPPKHFPEVPPPYEQVVGTGYLVEQMMQIQHSIGELKATVNQLKDASDKQSATLNTVSHRIYAAGAVIAVILTAGGFLLNKIWDSLVILIKMMPQ